MAEDTEKQLLEVSTGNYNLALHQDKPTTQNTNLTIH